MLRTRYVGSYPVHRLYRIGKKDAAELLTQGWTLGHSVSGRSFELIDPAGFAQYWLLHSVGVELAVKEISGV